MKAEIYFKMFSLEEEKSLQKMTRTFIKLCHQVQEMRRIVLDFLCSFTAETNLCTFSFDQRLVEETVLAI